MFSYMSREAAAVKWKVRISRPPFRMTSQRLLVQLQHCHGRFLLHIILHMISMQSELAGSRYLVVCVQFLRGWLVQFTLFTKCFDLPCVRTVLPLGLST